MTTERITVESSPTGGRPDAHRGVVTLWTLLMIPVLVVMFAVVVEGVHLWLARVELENALEAAALAAVKQWAEETTSPEQDWTEGAREVGQQYAAANTINQRAVGIGTNLGTEETNNPNENADCGGDLVFGSVTLDQADALYVFNANQLPGCVEGTGKVVMDVTSNNLTQAGVDNCWGVSFVAGTEAFNDNVLIDEITIDVRPNNTGDLQFSFEGSDGPPRLSTNATPKIQTSSQRQHDNYGFFGWIKTTGPDDETFDAPDGQWPASPQITFSPTTGSPTVLTISFSEYTDGNGDVDAGFSPGDRFRFRAPVRRGNATADGDDIGFVGARVTVMFRDVSNSSTWQVTGFFTDTGYSSNACADSGEWVPDDRGNYHLRVHPSGLGSSTLTGIDLPCPLSAAINNDKQSLVLGLGGAGADGVQHYAVRAQATHEVTGLIARFFGFNFGPFTVSAQTTAMYDCELQRPRLIRVKSFECE